VRQSFVDVFRGLLMAHMALDHVSLFFNRFRFNSEFWHRMPEPPVDLAQFLTRFTGVPVAPGFSFMAGFMVAVTSGGRSERGTSEGTITRRLIVRGLVLILAEALVFGLPMGGIRFEVLSCLGVSLILVALVRNAPPWLLLGSALAILGLHPLLPRIPVIYSVGGGVLYPVIPWVGFMLIGHVVGRAHYRNPDASVRRWTFAALAFAGAFLAVRLLRGYGNAFPYETIGSYAFFTWSKYPPDLAWTAWSLLMIFGALALLKATNPTSAPFRFVSAFGRVPFFFYLVHFIVLGVLALFVLGKDFKLPLAGVYAAWAALLVALWWPCRAYFGYKERNPKSLWRYL
jgi:uncharacterized membrane protein